MIPECSRTAYTSLRLIDMANKKTHPRFRVPNLGAKNRSGVKKRWRAQRGIDNKMRYKKKGHGAMPNIGYRNSDSVRYARSDGTFEVLVHNRAELMAVQPGAGKVVRLSAALSRRSRAELQRIADGSGLRIVNRS